MQADGGKEGVAQVSWHWTAALTAIGMLGAIHAVVTDGAAGLTSWSQVSLISCLSLSLITGLLITRRLFVVGYLVSLLAMLVAWRIAGLHGLTLVIWPLLAAFICFLLQFALLVRYELRRRSSSATMSMLWMLVLIRLYIGFDMVPHFTEKLFAGPGTFESDVTAFQGMGVPNAPFMVFLAGLCELGIAIGIGMGLLTRLAGVCAAVYFLVATFLGGHFHNGFIWASPGGGWEYPVLMMTLFLVFAAGGPMGFSLDNELQSRGLLPRCLQRLAIPARPGGAAKRKDRLADQ